MELKKAKNPWIVKIGNYLLSREDIKGNLKKEKKSLDECFTYIINELAKKAKESQQGRVGFASGEDEELYALAVHYYDEDDIKVVRGSYQTNADGSATYSQLQSKMEQNVQKSKKIVAEAQQKDEKVVKSESNEEEINKNRIMEREGLKKGEYFIVSAHREENIDSPQNFSNLLDTLSSIVQKYKKKVIVSTHPRTKKKLESIGFVNNNPLIEFMKPFGFLEYVKMEQNAFCVISDSGTITEESSILHFPAIMIRQAHERPEGMDEASVVMSGLRSDRVIESIDLVTSQYADDNNSIHSIKDYAPDNVSKKVVRIILSYTDYVNRVVWHKNEN